jgi:hypothetical protein
MADLDDELLALAGGDSSDSEASVTAQDHDHDLDNETNRDFPPSPPPDSTNNEPEQKDSGGKMGRKGVARSVVRRKKAKKDEDEEEEGEVYVQVTSKRAGTIPPYRLSLIACAALLTDSPCPGPHRRHHKTRSTQLP